MNNTKNSETKRFLLIMSDYAETIKRVRQNYITATPHSDEIQLETLYFKLTGEKLEQWSCPTCRLNNWRKFIKLYDKIKENGKETK